MLGAFHGHAELGEGGAGDVDVGERLDRLGHEDLAGAAGEGRRHEQAAHVLRAHVARDLEAAGAELAADRQGHRALGPELAAVLGEHLVKRGERALRKAPVPGQARVAAEGGDDGQQEAHRGAGLAAVKKGAGRDFFGGDDAEALLGAGDLRPEGAQALCRGVDVLGAGVAVDVGHAVGEGCADEQAVRLGLGGDGRDGPAEGGGGDSHIH